MSHDNRLPELVLPDLHSMDVDSSGMDQAIATEDWTQTDDDFLVTVPSISTSGSQTQSTTQVSQPSMASPAKPTRQTRPTTNEALRHTSSSGGVQLPNTPRDSTSQRQGPSRRESLLSDSRRGPPASAPAGSRMGELHTSSKGGMMFRLPLSIATVEVCGQEFFVHAPLLCQHSDYFARALCGGFAEAATQRVELDGSDVTPEDFGLWIDLLYRYFFHRPGTFVLRKEETGGSLSTRQILTLWRLSDRFLHEPMAALAEESLQHRLGLYSPEQWRKLYRTRPATDIRARVGRLQDAYHQCIDQGLPFADAVVAACANCPAQVYAECVDLLDPDFMALVSRRMILAHADGSLLSKDERAALSAAAATFTSGIGASDRGMR